MIVRKAQHSDMDFMIEELKLFSASYSTEYSLFPTDTDRAKELLKSFIDNHVVFVSSKEDGELTGFIAGLLTPHYFNPELITLTELFWWVKEEHRNTRAGATLYKAFLDAGKEMANWIVFSLKTGSPVKEEFFYKQNYKMTDRSFLLEVI
jgi:hypothetical protein